MKRQLFCARMGAYVVMAAALAGIAMAYSQGTSSAVASTPRLSNGKPDLSGMWVDAGARVNSGIGGTIPVDEKTFAGFGDGVVGSIFETRRPAPNQKGGQREATNEFTDFEFTTRLDPNRPLYKPQYWDKVQDLDYDTNFSDPVILFPCRPQGVPRMGLPTKIVQTVDEVILLYRNGEFRIIPTDGRGHDPDAVPTYRGDAIGHWEGDTLVVDVQSFNDDTWIGGPLAGIVGGAAGYFHSYELHVIERLRRDGNRLSYQATVEDSEVLLQPWTMTPREMRLNPKSTIDESICDGLYDRDVVVGRTRH